MGDGVYAGAIIVAAGRGERMGGGEKKQLRQLGSDPVYMWSVRTFAAARAVREIVIVTAEEDIDRIREDVARETAWKQSIRVIAGGKDRRASVGRGLAAMGRGVRWVLVHDGVRPFVSVSMVQRVLAAAQRSGAAVPGVPVADTIKEGQAAAPAPQASSPIVAQVARTPDRSRLWAVQTPQGFARDLLAEAHAHADTDPKLAGATDDAGLVEAMGASVAIVRGDERNIKITTETDFYIARYFAAQAGQEPGEPARGTVEGKRDQQPMVSARIATGFGFDVHQLASGRPLILGGVAIEHDKGLDGHSDADVLAHAVTDALLGAASLGDIGTHFPDTDPLYKDADSMSLLRQVMEKVSAAGAEVLHIDAFVSAERPRLLPYIKAMRVNLAEAIGVSIEHVNVKAGTGEARGPVGRGEVMEARAVATVRRA